MSITSARIQNTLIKSKRKFNVIEFNDNYIENSYVELFCLDCEKSLGNCELHYSSIDIYKYCHECIAKYIKPTPFNINSDIKVLEDYGHLIVIRYENISNEQTKQCYFSKNGRYINIKGKRIYV